MNLGFFSPHSTGTVKQWTYPSVLSDLNVSQNIAKKPNLNGAIIGFNIKNKSSFDLLNEWSESCLVKEYISPKDSSRENHRHDQSLLSILAYSKKINYYPKISFFFGISIHNWHDRIYFIQEPVNKYLNSVRKSWYKNYGNISTTTFKKAKIIIFLDTKSYNKFLKIRLLNKHSYVFSNNEEVKIKKINFKRKVHFFQPQQITSETIKKCTFDKYQELKT